MSKHRKNFSKSYSPKSQLSKEPVQAKTFIILFKASLSENWVFGNYFNSNSRSLTRKTSLSIN